MLEVQKYLSSGKTLVDLEVEFGIKSVIHPNGLHLVILNYSQIDSPKTEKIVRECRGLVLRSDSFELVCRSMHRFFNWGEVQEEMSLFDFSNFVVQSKEDGSLCIIYHFNGEWHANTRGSFALDNMQFQDFTWREGFCKALDIVDLKELEPHLDPQITYICEFVSPWNKIVRKYDTSKMYLLTAFRGHIELSHQEVDALNVTIFHRPDKYEFHSIEEIQSFLTEQSANDPTFEGVVIRDCNNNRWKCKSATYLGLHRLRGEDNMWNPKHLLPFIMTGEEDELLTYFEEVSETFFKLKAEVQKHYIKVLETWIDHKSIQKQKDFALAIQNKTAFKSVLFTVRKKYGENATSEQFKQEWRESEALILKHLKP